MPLPLPVGAFQHGLLGFTYGGIVHTRTSYRPPGLPAPYKTSPAGSVFVQLDDPDQLDLNGQRVMMPGDQLPSNMTSVIVSHPMDRNLRLLGVDGAWLECHVVINPGQRLFYRYAYVQCDATAADFAVLEIVASGGGGFRKVLQDGLSMQVNGVRATPWLVESWPPKNEPTLPTRFVGTARWLMCNGVAVTPAVAKRTMNSGVIPAAWRAFPSTLLIDRAGVQ